MKTAIFDYPLPEALIAQHPTKKREEARLLLLDRQSQTRDHRIFSDISNYFKEGDVLVLNDAKVIPARMFASKEKSESKFEVFLLEELAVTPPKNKDFPYAVRWRVLLKPGKKVRVGDRLHFLESGKQDPDFFAVNPPEDTKEAGAKRLLDFYSSEPLEKKIKKYGVMPLPPYIRREATEEDKVQYQTIFAKKEGAVAAPTAGLHFDEALLQALREKGVEILYVTLHVGYDTFRPVQTEDIESHPMHTEKFEISEETATKINAAKEEGRRVIACGTTVVRALESAFSANQMQAGQFETDIFIYPSYEFKVVDALITNFHLPKSSLVMLVAAFGGTEFILETYQKAIAEKYRFFSYGDAMFIY